MFCYEGGYHKQFYFNEEKTTGKPGTNEENKTYIDHVIPFSIIPPPFENGCYVNVWHEQSLISKLLINVNAQNTTENEGWGIMNDGELWTNHYRIFNRQLFDRNHSKTGIV